MTTKRKTKTMVDHRGYEVPVDMIPVLTKKKHRKAVALVKKAKKLNEQLVKYKQEYFEAMDDFYQEDASTHGVIGKGKGGYSITSFDKAVKLEINVSTIISFSNEIQFAQELINEFLKEKTNNDQADHDLSALVNHAFSVRKGKLDKSRLIGLFSLKINNDKWQQAMDIIKNSMSVDDTKRYPQVYEKNSNGEYKAILLNLSSL